MLKKLRPAIFTILICFLGIPAISQQKVEVSGRVIDIETRNPMIGVNVIIKGKQIGTITNEKGYFYLSTRTELPFTLRFSMIGFQTQEYNIKERIKSGIRMRLKSAAYLGKEIVLSAPVVEVEQKTMRKNVSIEVLDALSIKDTPSPNFYNAIGNLKGVDVITQSMQFMTVNARGFNSTVNTRFVQIVDGMDNQAPGMNFAIGNIAGLSQLDVESVEFLPGPSSAKYGGNVLNGMLLIKSKDPFQFQGISFYIKPGVSDVRSGTDHPFQFFGKGLFDAGVRFAKAWNDKIALKFNASYMKGEDWFADDTTNIRPGSIHWELDPGHDALNKYGDEVTKELPVGDHGENIIVARTGYRDKYLINNQVYSLKFGGALHYKLNDRARIILEGNYGKATTAYTEDNRISLSDFEIYQGKIEINSNHLLFRAYGTQQNTGLTYDSKYLAYHLNNAWKSDEDWFRDYYNAYRGALAIYGVKSGDYREARAFADKGRLMPGTPEFETEKERIIHITDFYSGARMINNSSLYNIDAGYNFGNLDKTGLVEIGGNYRYYDLGSQGTIFPDTLGNDITYFEYGSFIQFSKNFLDNALSLSTSLRYDKSENFQGHLTPRLSVGYSLYKTHHFRASVMTGYRNPSGKEQFVNKDLGAARILGGLKKNIAQFNLPENSMYLPGILEFNEAVFNDVTNEDFPMTPIQASIKNLNILENSVVHEEDLQELLPEQVLSYEIGYKTKFIDKVFFDAVFYHSLYKNFIGLVKIVKPRTSPAVDLYTASTQINSSTQREQLFIYTNSHKAIGIQGFAMGVKYITPIGALLSGNFTWTNLTQQIDDPLVPGFNTPNYKFNVSIANRKLDKLENNPGFKNIGFNVVWRWQSKTYWNSAFGEGWIDPASTWDLQVSYRFHQPESILKVGITNFFNLIHTTSFGGPQVGSFYYVSFLVENILNSVNNRKK